MDLINDMMEFFRRLEWFKVVRKCKADYFLVNGQPPSPEQLDAISKYFDEMEEWFDKVPKFPSL
jgi:hypothetical protein